MSIYVRVGEAVIRVPEPGGPAWGVRREVPVPIEAIERAIADARAQEAPRSTPARWVRAAGDPPRWVQRIDGEVVAELGVDDVDRELNALLLVHEAHTFRGAVAEWREWARALLKGEGDDEEQRRKISAVVEAPAVIESLESKPAAVDDGEGVRGGSCGVCGDKTIEVAELLRGQSASTCPACGRKLWSERPADDGQVEPEPPRKKVAPEVKHNPFVVEACSRVMHDVYREASSGDAIPSWDRAPEDLREISRVPVREVLEGKTPRQWHAKWRVRKMAEGWTYGPVLDEEARTHPNLVAYDELPSGQRALDDLCVVAVRAVRRALADYEDACSVPLALGPDPEKLAELNRRFHADVNRGARKTQFAVLEDAPAASWVNDPFARLDALGVAVGKLTPAKLRQMFENHCECRPVNTARAGHSHDCDTGITDDIRTLLHHVAMPGDDEAVQGELRSATMQEEIVAMNRLAAHVTSKENP